jgi:ubiquinone/menaquinone biosynthesis C-methylase UbiE
MEMTGLEKWLLASPAWGAFSKRVLVPWVVSFARPPSEAWVLELGCGRGSEAEVLAERFPDWRLTATDYDTEMVSLAEKRLSRFGERVGVEEADASALPYPAGSFDLVLAVLVWHHVGDWRKATAEAARVLRPGGWLVLADALAPFFAGPTGRLFAPAGTYTFGELREAIRDAGFRRWRVRRGPLWYRLVAEGGGIAG